MQDFGFIWKKGNFKNMNYLKFGQVKRATPRAAHALFSFHTTSLAR